MIHVLLVAKEDNLGVLQNWIQMELILEECGDIVILVPVLQVNRILIVD